MLHFKKTLRSLGLWCISHWAVRSCSDLGILMESLPSPPEAVNKTHSKVILMSRLLLGNVISEGQAFVGNSGLV